MYYIVKEIEDRIDRLTISKLPQGINIQNERDNKVEFFDMEIEFVEKGSNGNIASDIINEPVPFFSEKVLQLLEIFNVENIFYKPCTVVNSKKEITGQFYMGVIDKIECLDYEKSVFEGEKIKKAEINEEKTGWYKIFRVKGIEENVIVVDEELKEEMGKKLFGIRFIPITQYVFNIDDKEKNREKSEEEKLEEKYARIRNIMKKK